MKYSTKRWLSALLALTMTFSALPLEAGALNWKDIGSLFAPPSQEEVDEGKELWNWFAQKAEEEEQKLKEKLGEAYESYNRLKDTDFSAITVALTVKAEGLGEADSVTATLSGGEYSKELTLSKENSWTAVEQVPLFSGELSYENRELQFPQNIEYHVSVPAIEGFNEPVIQDFVLNFDWTQVNESWQPAAMATVTYTAQQEAPSVDPEAPNDGGQDEVIDEPQSTDFTAAVQWEDESVPAWLRPDVSVQLLADGEPVGEAVTLNLLNGWTYTWEELPVEKVSELALLTAEESSNRILYQLEYSAPQGYSLESENGLITASLVDELKVPLDAVVFWEHGDNEGTLPNSMTLNIGEDEIEIEDTENNRGNVWYEELGNVDLLDEAGIIDYSKVVSVEPPTDYMSRSWTFPFYSAGAEDAARLKDWLLSLSPSEAAEELAELPTLENLPQTYAESAQLRWLTVVQNTYTKPYEPPQQGDNEGDQTKPDEEQNPQTPVTVTVPVDVLTIWNDRGVEHLRPATVSCYVVDRQGLLVGPNDKASIDASDEVKKQYIKDITVGNSYVGYEPNVLTVKETVESIKELTFMASFEGMNLYDREVLLLKIPNSGIDLSALSMMSVSQLKNWASQQRDADLSGGFKLLAIAINSRQAYGSLSVYKDVRDMDDYNITDNTKFTYRISLIYPDLSSKTKTVEISENEPLVLNDLPVGTRYSVLEEGRYGYISEDIDCLQSGVIKEGSNSLTFVNRKFNLIVRMDWVNTSSWRQDDVRVYVDDNRYVLGNDNLWSEVDYAYGISDLRYRDLAVRGLPEGYEEDYSIRWKNHVAIVTVTAEYDYDYEVEDDWKDKAEDDEYRVLAKVVWVGGDAEKRPTVSAQLYRDGKSYRDVATLKSSKNSLRDWRYVWEDVSGDEDNNWNVKVTKVPAGYSCEVTKVKDNYFIITCTWKDSKENVYTGA